MLLWRLFSHYMSAHQKCIFCWKKVADVSEPINFQSKNTVSSKRAESRGEALIENKVLVTAAWPSPLTFHSPPPPNTSLSFVFLHLPLLNFKHICQ